MKSKLLLVLAMCAVVIGCKEDDDSDRKNVKPPVYVPTAESIAHDRAAINAMNCGTDAECIRIKEAALLEVDRMAKKAGL